MNDVMISSLKSYWERLRAGRIAPYRAEIDPREFETALENMFIVERIAPDNLRIRLAGMKVCEMIGMEVRGMQPGLFVTEPERSRFERLLSIVMTEPAVVELGLDGAGRPMAPRGTMLLMPLRSDFGEINRVLGCVSVESAFFQPPLAFTLREVSINPVHAAQDMDEARRAMPGFAEEPAGYQAPEPGPRLRSIEGNPSASTKGRARPKLRVIDCE